MNRLEEALDALVEQPGGHGDWPDVLRRAGVSAPRPPVATPPPRRRRRLVFGLVALVVLAGVVGLLATPAFGLRDAVLGLFDRQEVEFEEGAPAPAPVRWQFEDLAIGAPPSMAPQAIAAETRLVGRIRARGRERNLYVAPTRRGGFCYMLDQAYGGCLRNDATPLPPLVLTWSGGMRRGDERFRFTHLGGNTLAERIEQVTVEFHDGHVVAVPLVWVSAPVAAGFFAYDVPAARQSGEGRPRAVVARDSAGRVVHREALVEPSRRVTPPPTEGPRRTPRPLPTQPPVPPTEPLQRASAHGVSAIAGRNGVVVFDTTGLSGERRELLRRGGAPGWSCFRLRLRGGNLFPRGYSVSGAFADRVARRWVGVETPFDACEIQGSYGHIWPDRFGSHAAVELPFTSRARAWFEDRAAARDVSLLVRSRRMQEIRRLEGAALARALATEYGGRIARLAARGDAPPSGRIGYWIGDGGATFVRVSTTGRRFEVVTRAGRIAEENVRPLAFVF